MVQIHCYITICKTLTAFHSFPPFQFMGPHCSYIRIQYIWQGPVLPIQGGGGIGTYSL
jgi:hypothetical protein